MIPVLLEIEGLYSYREKQRIEFEKLTAAGLFGIFGAVGSGKSSILEAILLALYGSTERLAATGERSSMVNLQSDHLLINFTFHAGKNNTKTYLARYSAKRNKKDPEKIETGEHTFYQQNGADWEALTQKADELIGMSKEHFKQTVIIPQGKFREFIDQKPLDRAEMMQQLFGLDRFDLSQKTGSLLKATREEKIRLDTQLKGLEEISIDLLTNKQAEEKDFQVSLALAQNGLQEAEVKFKALEHLQKQHIQLQEQQGLLAQLESKKPEIEEKRRLLKEFLTAKRHLKPVWDRLQDAQKDLEKYRVSQVDCERFQENFTKEVALLEAEELRLREKNEERPIREARIRDLKKVIEIQELEGKLGQAKAKLDTIKPDLDQRKEKLKSLESELEKAEESLDQLPVPNTDLLTALQSLAENEKICMARKGELQQLRATFQKEEKVVRSTISDTLALIPSPFSDLESWAQHQKSRIQSLEKEREAILRKQGLGSHVHLLVSGEPCPLCGSSEHPHPMEAEADEKGLRTIDIQLMEVKNELERILALISKLKVEEANLENHGRNIQEKSREIDQLDQKLQEIYSKLTSLDILDSTALKAKIQGLSQAGNQREQLAQKIQSQRKIWNTTRQEVDEASKGLVQWENTIITTQSLILSKKAEIKDPTFCKPFLSKTSAEIQSAIAKVTQDIEDAATSLLGKQKHLQERRAAQIKNQSDLENYTQRVSENERKVEENSRELEKLMLEFGFPNPEALHRLLHQSLEEEKVEAELRTFDQRYHLCQNKLAELQLVEGIQAYSERNFTLAQESLTQAKNLVQELHSQLLLLQESIKQISQQLEGKLELSKLYDLVENRENGLREMERLFQGKGFVKYVSSIYLRELCQTANSRFMKLTKNSLSLEIDGDNTFWVIDYLNGGKKRLLKTLSGGQTFQASLCLALALAEKVKALNQADQSFFFLDEGFGALDKNALRVVFETLKSLRHENRVVGIISHVEELQQEIGVFAQVELDAERGSQISYSY